MKSQLEQMAYLHHKHTGLSSDIISLYNGALKYPRSKVQVKVLTNRGWITIIISDTILSVNMRFSKEEQIIIDESIEYIRQNKDVFIRHWFGKLTDKELMDILFRKE